MKQGEAHPSDPYQSFLVKASAGSGKTYQLSDRYLKLIAAGAEPRATLALTFTLKAAAEMKARILSRAQQLLDDPGYASQFTCELAGLYGAAQSRAGTKELSPPLSAAATAAKILGARRQLAIQTIDSLFYEWKEQYVLPQTLQRSGLSVSADPNLMSQAEITSLYSQIWASFFAWPWQRAGADENWAGASSQLHALACGEWYRLRRIQQRVTELGDHAIKIARDKLHHDQQSSATAFQPFTVLEKLTHESERQFVTLAGGTATEPHEQMRGFVVQLAALMHQLIHQAGKQQRFAQLLPGLQQLRELTTQGSEVAEGQLLAWLAQAREDRLFSHEALISKNTIRLRDKLGLDALIDQIETMVRVLCDRRLLRAMVHAYRELYGIYQQTQDRLAERKEQIGKATHADHALLSHQLVCSAQRPLAKAKILGRIQHVLIDELQDTSLIQWDIFQEISTHLFTAAAARSTKLVPTVFMVGDPKQSLYTFREAVPYVVTAAQQLMDRHGYQTLHLEYNYRSQRSLCDYVAEVFRHHHLAEFEPARIHPSCASGQANLTAICALSAGLQFSSAEPSAPGVRRKVTLKDQLQQEAQALALHLRQVLAHPHEYPILAEQGQRPLQPGDIAILYRSATHAALFEDALRQQGINVVRAENSGFFAHSEIKDCMHLLRLCVYPADVLSLIAVAASPIGQVDDAALMDFLETTAEVKHSYEAAAMLAMTWQSYFYDHAPLRLVAEFLQGAHQGGFGRRFCALLIELRVDQQYFEMYTELGQPLEAERAAVMVRQFMDWVAAEPDHESGISIYHRMLRRQEEPQESALASPHAVVMMTIHKAKGLEFGMVCLTQSATQWNMLGKDSFFTVPVSEQTPFESYLVPQGTLFKEPVIFRKRLSPLASFKELRRRSLYEESLRLLYVALTRAEQYLIISGPDPQLAAKDAADDAPARDAATVSDSATGPCLFWPALRDSVRSRQRVHDAAGEHEGKQTSRHVTEAEPFLELTVSLDEYVSQELMDYRRKLQAQPSADAADQPLAVDAQGQLQAAAESLPSELSLQEAIQGLAQQMKPWLAQGQLRSKMSPTHGASDSALPAAVAMASSESRPRTSCSNVPASHSTAFQHLRAAAGQPHCMDDGQRQALFRGNYIHKCLEMSLRHKTWRPLAMDAIPTDMGASLDLALIQEVEAEAQRSYHNIMSRIGAAEYWPEVWLCGPGPDQQLIQGKADLVIHHEASIEIVDFKTKIIQKTDDLDLRSAIEVVSDEDLLFEWEGRPGIDPSYVQQLALYRSCLCPHFDKSVTCSVFLTHSQQWVPITFV